MQKGSPSSFFVERDLNRGGAVLQDFLVISLLFEEVLFVSSI